MEENIMEKPPAEEEKDWKMNCRFHVESPLDRELITEGYRVILLRSWRFILGIILTLACLGFAVKYAADAARLIREGYTGVWEKWLPYILFWAALGIANFVLHVTYPGRCARQFIRQREALYGDTAHQKAEYFFCDESVHTEGSSGAKIDTAYTQIRHVYETQHGIILKQKENLFHILDKSRIDGGSPEELIAFLKEKLPWAAFYNIPD